MQEIFLKLFNMSITAGWLILAVMVLRILLKRAPKWIVCLLWGLVAVRLACPVSLESVFSLIPSGETVRQEVLFSERPVIDSGIRLVDNVVNPMLRESFTPQPGDSVNPLQVVLFIAGVLWAAGALGMLLYAGAGYGRLRWKLRTAVRLEEPVYLSEFVDTPFVFGVLRARIYLPVQMPEGMREPVIAHEKAHLARRDHLWKILGYFLLAVYWFHPLCWAAYALFCKDMELACDERVIREYDSAQKRAYSEALLECSLKKRTVIACPLAFGEVGVKDRIRSVVNYKKPAFWVVMAAAAACIVAGVCFLTDPVREEKPDGIVWVNPEEPGAEGGNPGKGVSGVENGNVSDGILEAGNTEGSGDGDSLRFAFISKWAQAFVSRDGNAIAGLAGEELISRLKERELLFGSEGQYSFGESSPWPRDPEKDVLVRTMEEGQAEIIYYAWTSEPRVTVWKEKLSYELQGEDYRVVSEELIFYDNISSGEEFAEAYDVYSDGEGSYLASISGTRMDYSANEAGQDLCLTAALSSSMQYRPLFEPEEAAMMLLNLAEEAVEVEVLNTWSTGALSRLSSPLTGWEDFEAGDGVTDLLLHFTRDNVTIKLSMLYSGQGIWIPGDYKVNSAWRFSLLDWDEVRSRHLSVNDDPDWSDIICIGEIPEKKIKLYGYNDEECSGEGVAIEIGDDVNYFDWIYTSPRSLLPECYWNEGDRQLQVALNIYTGTGVDAQELHVLQQYDTGTLMDSVFDLDDYAQLLGQCIDFSYDGETGELILSDSRSGKELAAAKLPDADIVGLETGMISHFVLGDKITLQVEVGYLEEGIAMPQYEDAMPTLEAEVVPGWGAGGGMTFDFGEIREVR